MDKLLDICEKISPSLDMNDKTTMKESVNSLTNKVTHINATAEQKEKDLHGYVADWQSYQVGTYNLKENYITQYVIRGKLILWNIQILIF